MDQMNYKSSPKLLRVSQMVLGAIAIILSLAILLNPGVGITTLIILLSITLFVAGLERVAAGIFTHNITKSSRAGNIVLGVLALGLGIGVMAFPVYTTIFLVALLAVGLLFVGIARIIQGITNKQASKWSRAGLIGVGILSLAVSFIVFAHPVSGAILLSILLAANLLIIGVESVVQGAAGKESVVTSSTVAKV